MTDPGENSALPWRFDNLRALFRFDFDNPDYR